MKVYKQFKDQMTNTCEIDAYIGKPSGNVYYMADVVNAKRRGKEFIKIYDELAINHTRNFNLSSFKINSDLNT